MICGCGAEGVDVEGIELGLAVGGGTVAVGVGDNGVGDSVGITVEMVEAGGLFRLESSRISSLKYKNYCI